MRLQLRCFYRLQQIIMTDFSFVSDNLKLVQERLGIASDKRSSELKVICPNPRLVAVSKTKPVALLSYAYKEGQRHFGENYVQELVDKANDPDIVNNCPEIKLHFIGHLQKNKVAKILSVVSKVFVIETLDSEGLAKSLNDGLVRRNASERLNVMVQVNTSGEEAKSGVEPEACLKLVHYVINDCPQLSFMGLMTIGALEPDSEDPNRDFKELFRIREEVCKELGLERKDVELSMGMSGDFEEAVELGSTNIRVGSTIFGARQKK